MKRTKKQADLSPDDAAELARLRELGTLEPFPFERPGFRVTEPSKYTYDSNGKPIGTLISFAPAVDAWLRKLRDAEQAAADQQRICDCGARNVHDTHSATCWARPLPPFPFEQPKRQPQEFKGKLAPLTWRPLPEERRVFLASHKDSRWSKGEWGVSARIKAVAAARKRGDQVPEMPPLPEPYRLPD